MLSILAAEAPTSTGVDLSPLWLQYGAIGLMCAVLIWFAYRAYKREADRADRLEAKVDQLNQVMRDQEGASAATIESMRQMIFYLQTGHHSPESPAPLPPGGA